MSSMHGTFWRDLLVLLFKLSFYQKAYLFISRSGNPLIQCSQTGTTVSRRASQISRVPVRDVQTSLKYFCIPIGQHNFQMFSNGSHCFPIRHHQFHMFPKGIHRVPEKNSLILNPHNFFSRHFKTILNGKTLNIHLLLSAKNGADFVSFSECTRKMIEWCPIGNEVTYFSNIYLSKYKGHQRLLMPDRAS